MEAAEREAAHKLQKERATREQEEARLKALQRESEEKATRWESQCRLQQAEVEQLTSQLQEARLQAHPVQQWVQPPPVPTKASSIKTQQLEQL